MCRWVEVVKRFPALILIAWLGTFPFISSASAAPDGTPIVFADSPDETSDDEPNEPAEDGPQEEPDLNVEGLDLEEAALFAIAFDPWLLTDGEIPIRREMVVTNRRQRDAQLVEADAKVAEAVGIQDALEVELARVQAIRDKVEQDLEGYAIRIWSMGDDGLQESYGSDFLRARLQQPIQVATADLVERLRVAGENLSHAVIAVDEAAEVVRLRRIDRDEALSRLRVAQQIRQQFEAKLVARNEAISRRTHEVLVKEADPITLVQVVSVVVRTPVVDPEDEADDGSSGDPTDDGSEGPIVSTDTEDPNLPSEGEQPEPEMTEQVVAITPITVNAEIADSLVALIGAAMSDGVDLSGWGYRDRENQIILRRGNCGSSGYAIFEQRSGTCSPPTARPGFSQHEKGLAIDFTQGGAILNSSSSGFLWLQANAATYGLINLPSEPWHWSTTGR